MSCYFWPILTPSPPVTLCHTSRTPQKYVTHLGPPSWFLVGLVQKTLDKSPLYKFSLNCSRGFCPGGFVRGLLSGRFCPGWFCLFPLLSEYICYNRKLNIALNFMFHMYVKKIYKCDVTCSLPLPSVTNCHTFSDPSPLERDVLYGQPLGWLHHSDVQSRIKSLEARFKNKLVVGPSKANLKRNNWYMTIFIRHFFISHLLQNFKILTPILARSYTFLLFPSLPVTKMIK